MIFYGNHILRINSILHQHCSAFSLYAPFFRCFIFFTRTIFCCIKWYKNPQCFSDECRKRSEWQFERREVAFICIISSEQYKPRSICTNVSSSANYSPFICRWSRMNFLLLFFLLLLLHVPLDGSCNDVPITSSCVWVIWFDLVDSGRQKCPSSRLLPHTTTTLFPSKQSRRERSDSDQRLNRRVPVVINDGRVKTREETTRLPFRSSSSLTVDNITLMGTN